MCGRFVQLPVIDFGQPGLADLAPGPDDAMAILLASSPPSMEAYRVSRAVNSPRSNAEQLLTPIG